MEVSINKTNMTLSKSEDTDVIVTDQNDSFLKLSMWQLLCLIIESLSCSTASSRCSSAISFFFSLITTIVPAWSFPSGFVLIYFLFFFLCLLFCLCHRVLAFLSLPHHSCPSSLYRLSLGRATKFFRWTGAWGRSRSSLSANLVSHSRRQCRGRGYKTKSKTFPSTQKRKTSTAQKESFEESIVKDLKWRLGVDDGPNT